MRACGVAFRPESKDATNSHLHKQELAARYLERSGRRGWLYRIGGADRRVMYICLCNGFTDRQVRRSLEDGSVSVAQVYRGLGCAPKCGRCVPVVRDMLKAICPSLEAESVA
jgi:bacterioferritin-associated ferredoxin